MAWVSLEESARMSDIPPRLADLNIDGLLARLEAEAAQPASAPPAASSAVPATSSPKSDERRTARRRERHELSGDIRLTIPGVSNILMVNISETGVLIETSRRLSPGMTADLFVRLNGTRHAMRATTVRSTFHAIRSKSEVVYRTALQFDRLLPLDAE